jgi:nematocidal protein AidA
MSEQENQQIIDVLLVIDAQTIVGSYPPGTAANPTSIDRPLIFMMVKTADVLFGQASKELKIKAQTLDEMRWRETTLSLNSAYFGLIYGFFALRGQDLLSTPSPLLAEVKTPLPNPQDPTHPTTQSIKNYFWSTTILKPGEATYAFNFMILDRHNAVQGYYFWDPFISITD